MEANRARGVIVALLTLSLVTVSLLTVWSPSVQAQSPAVDYDIKVEKSVVVIDIRPGQIGMANNTITLTNNGNHSLIIEVRSYCGVFIVLPSIQFVPLRYNQSVTIPISIFAPAERPLEHADCAVEARKVDVYGPTPDPGFRYTDFKAVVLQSINMEVEHYSGGILKPGEQTQVLFKIYNRGNITDDYYIEIINRPMLERAGYSMSYFTPVIMGVEPNGYVTIKITIQAPHPTLIGWTDEYITLELRVSSITGDNRLDYRSDTVTLWVRGLYIDYLPIGVIILFTFWGVALASQKIKNKKEEERFQPPVESISYDEFKRP